MVINQLYSKQIMLAENIYNYMFFLLYLILSPSGSRLRQFTRPRIPDVGSCDDRSHRFSLMLTASFSFRAITHENSLSLTEIVSVLCGTGESG